MHHSKFFYLIILTLVLVVSGQRFIQYRVLQNFTLHGVTNCDTTAESCFVSDCDTEDCDTAPYKKLFVSAKDAPKCLYENNCENFACENLSDCEIIYCNDETLDEGEICSQEES